MERTFIEDKILLCGEIGEVKYKRTFNIHGRLGDGGASAIGYEASYEGGTRGVLREFYPKDCIILERNSDNQLVIKGDFGDAIERYQSERDKYLNSYKRLSQIIRENPNSELNKYLPNFEIYYGCDEELNPIGTCYIWTPEPKLVTFETLCKSIHERPGKRSEYKLISLIKGLEILTEALMDLHRAGFIHRDIKPSNFGFQMFNNEVRTQNFKIFDIDSICSVLQRKIENTVYSEGFTEPEALSQRPSTQTDIYSIGASLFYAIVVTPELKNNGYLYDESYYNRIEELVSTSELITASESNSHPRLRYTLSQILKKCLCSRSKRYQNCEELLADLKIAEFYALPGEVSTMKNMNDVWVLKDKNENVKSSFDRVAARNSSMVFINHLYDVPFYRNIDSDKTEIDILILGFGNYGQKFLDILLQTGQMMNKRLRISVISLDETDKTIYLNDRPEMSNFFNINGNNPGNESYGDINFITQDFNLEHENRTLGSIRAKLSQFVTLRELRFKYCFVALGNDEFNRKIADAVFEIIDRKDNKVIVSYVSERALNKGKALGNKSIYPIYVNESVKEFSHNEEIERMAFNIHLTWEKNLNVDLDKIRKEFLDPYNHMASICAVLSLKYKLYSLGYDLDTMSIKEIADTFDVDALINDLVYLEHRRWVSEKICAGWKKREVKDALDGVTRDRRVKNHICILKSEPNQNLKNNVTTNGLYAWDSMDKETFDSLDELDRMSVELHRGYCNKISKLDMTSLLRGSKYKDIYSLIEGNNVTLRAFQEWFSCVTEISIDSPENAQKKIKLYDSLLDEFKRAVALNLPSQYKKVEPLVDKFDDEFQCVIRSREYRDWKSDDELLTLSAPFILTYTTEKTTLVVPFSFGNSEKIFSNIAACSVVNPEKLIFLVLIENEKNQASFIDALSEIVSFMKKKNIRSTLEIHLFFEKSVGATINKNYEKNIVNICEGFVNKVKRISYKDAHSAIWELDNYFSFVSAGENLFAVEKNSSSMSKLLAEYGIYDNYSSYEFDSANMEFKNCVFCSMLQHINKFPYFTCSEALSFINKYDFVNNKPEFYNDYKELWEYFRLNSDAWKVLPFLLGIYSSNDVVASFVPQKRTKSKVREYKYIIPHFCATNAKKLINFLKEHKVIENESYVCGNTSDSCLVNIVDPSSSKKLFDKIFGNVTLLSVNKMLQLVYDEEKNVVNVIYDSLNVKGLNINCEEKESIVELLKFFENKGYINCLNVTKSGKASFSYSTTSFKRFLRNSNAIIEIYAYHSIKELCFADDIISSYDSDPWGSPTLNEFDIIITKGFKMLFVKCLTEFLDSEEYRKKLVSYVRKHGINAKVIFLTDSNEPNYYSEDMIVISERDDVDNVGHTLLNIMENNY